MPKGEGTELARSADHSILKNVRRFKCCICRKTFNALWSDADAIDEANRLFGGRQRIDPDSLACGDCFGDLQQRGVIPSSAIS